MQVVQNFMGPKQRIAFANTGQKYDSVLWGLLHELPDQDAVILVHLHGSGSCPDDIIKSAALLITDIGIHKVLALQVIHDHVIEIKNHQFKAIRTLGVFLLHVFDSLTNLKLLGRIIIEYPVVHLIGSSGTLPEFGLMDSIFHLI